MTENFILTQYIEDLSLCDDIIEWHKNTDMKGPGVSGARKSVKENIKISTDSCLNNNLDLLHRYFEQLRKVSNAYIEKYPFANYYCGWDIIEGTNVQHYEPGEAYFSWHTERCGMIPPSSYRHLVYMTYLNDVDDGGETEFFHQQLKIQPKKGLTVMWPTDWTHTHRGIVSPTQDKYVVTGWYNFIE